METRKEDGFWKWVNENVTRILAELKEESVAGNSRKPADGCKPPTPVWKGP